MRRAAVYLRYSSDRQRPSSLEDQLRICRRWIEANGYQLDDANIFQDAAISGQTVAGRAGLESLVSTICVTHSPVDALVVENCDRLSREMGDSFTLFRRLNFFGVELVGVADGIRSSDPNAKLNFGIRAVLNEHFIDNLRHKTMRGLEGQALKNRCTGGRIYGYRSVPVSENPDDGKKRVVQEIEAEIVRFIFGLAKDGKTIAEILAELVKREAPPPDPGRRSARRRGWCQGSLRNILRNPHYAGRIDWNRRKGEKNPLTGKKVYRPRPESEVIHKVNPELAIISEQLFDEVQAIIKQRSIQYGRSNTGQLQGRKLGTTYSSSLLSGILKCGQCGGAMCLVGGKTDPNTGEPYRQYACAYSKKRGHTTCGNVVTISKKKIEQAVINKLNASLLSDENIDFFEDEFRAAFAEEMSALGGGKRVEKLRKEISAQAKKVERLVGYLEESDSEAVTPRLKEAEKRLQELRAALADLQGNIGFHAPPPTAAIRNELLRLRDALNGDDPTAAKSALKAVVGELKMKPKKVREEIDPKTRKIKCVWAYEVTGEALIQNILVPLVGEPGCPSVIAGAGFEPATFGL